MQDRRPIQVPDRVPDLKGFGDCPIGREKGGNRGKSSYPTTTSAFKLFINLTVLLAIKTNRT